jgi:hypothetical protein
VPAGFIVDEQNPAQGPVLAHKILDRRDFSLACCSFFSCQGNRCRPCQAQTESGPAGGQDKIATAVDCFAYHEISSSVEG